MSKAVRPSESGFSLVELTVALVVTLIVSGAIYGLLASGQSAFRREPELSDRQQNARVAMDLIMKDIGNAGSGVPPQVQVFTPNLNAFAAAPMGLGGVRTDELEMLTNDGGHDNEPACHSPGDGSSADIRLVRNTGTLSGPVIIVMEDGTWTMRNIVSQGTNNTGAGNCTAGADKTQLGFNQGAGDTTNMNTPGGTCKPSALGVGNAGAPADGGTSVANCPSEPVGPGPCCQATEISFTQLVRYRIRNDANGVPNLERSTTGDISCGGFPCYQTIARGIEDLQVRYTTAAGATTDSAPVLVNTNWGTLITRVEVTLSSRSEALNIAGASTDANLGTRVRGRLSWVGTPRSTLIALTRQPSPAPTPLWK